MTEKLYYKDSYIKDFTAKVIDCRKCEQGYEIILDRTAFFPEGGGQSADTGTIDGISVIDVQENKDGSICHIAERETEVGKEVFCKIDFNKRFRKMQNHSGEHIVSGLINRIYGFDNVGFHLGSVDVTMDYNGTLTREDLLKIEYLANEACVKNIEIKQKFPKSEELGDLSYRSKLDITENVRLVDIEGYDSCACCAPHVKSTGSIGMIKLLDFIKYKGGVRVHMKCGFDALDDYNDKYANVSEIAQSLSVKQSEASMVVQRLLFELSEKKHDYAKLYEKYITEKINVLEYSDGNLLYFEENLENDVMRAAANLGRSKCSGVFGVFSGNDGEGYRFIMTSEKTALREFVKNLALELSGGGSDEMQQGKCNCTKEKIEKAFSQEQ